MIVREKNPVNLEMPFGEIDGFITPADRFYVRCHHPIPAIDIDAWRLKIEGDVESPFELSYAELSEMATRTITTTMECAGNGRVFLEPQRDGAQWEAGAVGTAEWTGVPLADLLARAGVRDGVREVILQGADEGEIKDPPRPAGKIHFARSLPLGKANDDVLIALRMNGEKLSPAHGFPARAVVPGWYGMAAVKWLTEIVATREPFQGYYQTIDYAYWKRGPASPVLTPVREMRIKSQIARPEYAENVPAGQPYRVHGAAWTGGAEVTKVEVSTDGGTTWHDARLVGDPVPDAWRLWEYEWDVPAKPGKAVLMARATDSEGRTQPARHDEDGGSYLIHHWIPIEVEIR
ncbi:sulfite oxidase [Luteimonas vadosa]|uniref:Sulfite oxidase n=2 Tax=Luteimonas vadosa TaxID=1165507 RepID=A0ABP9E4Q0_9GAMM